MKWRRTRRHKYKPTAAIQERQRSERLNRQAQAIARDLHEIRRENHFAEALKRLIEGDQ